MAIKLTAIIPIEVFRREVMLFFGSLEDLQQELKRCEIDDPDIISDIDNCYKQYQVNAITYNTGSEVIIYAKEIPSIPTLLHELTHAVFDVFKQIDVDPTAENEVYAYTFEYLATQVFKWLDISCSVPLQTSVFKN